MVLNKDKTHVFLPVVRYVTHLTCIFMNINENLKNEVTSYKKPINEHSSAPKHLQTINVASFNIISDTV